MGSQTEHEDLSISFPQKERSKEKTEGTRSIASRPIANRTIGEGSIATLEPQEPFAQQVTDHLDNRQDKAARTRNQLINFEIDEYLYQLISEGMVTEQFLPYFAKACHVLGISTVNRLKINAMNGKDRQKLFAYKIKGALTLHFKREYLDKP